jgi:hypothetical protein
MGFTVFGEWEDNTPPGETKTAEDILDGNESWGGWIQREDGARIPRGIYTLILEDGLKSRSVSIDLFSSMSSTRVPFLGGGPQPT